MSNYWKDLLPVDPYVVKSHGLLQDLDRQIVTLLYQPLIGSFSLSLFFTLWGELEQNRIWGNSSTHRQLMGTMQASLKTIHAEKEKLEGIGLLKTYVKETEQERLFIYELIAPLRPDEFFQDGMLNVFLYNRVGKARFQQLKDYFSHPSVPEEARDVTRSFNEVFAAVQPSEWKLSDDMADAMKLSDDREYTKEGQSKPVAVTDDAFDFQLFLAGLSETLIPRKALTGQVKETIKKLAFLYGIEPLDMQNVVMSAVDEHDMITTEALRKAASDWYQIERNGLLPELVDKVQPLRLREHTNEQPASKEETLIALLEQVSPRKLLQDIAGGAEPSKADLKIIEEIMLDQKLEPGVINVLIYYVMLRTDMKLSKNYIQKIASHWARKKVKTVREAMKLAKEENRQYLEWAQGKKKQGNKKVIREEKLPDWLQNEAAEALPKDEQTAASKEDFELQKQKLLEEVKKLRNHSAL
ncbi:MULTISPECIES: replication initiation and membrane attachment family protein [Bacillus]|uniref:Replication initiation and membrane attachment protein n=1 Tax=Bacillus glycinifermentans TaxID=1664069 RepID=A0AAJ3Z067_9BACI|nr:MULTISPECIES: replication initiation and membrane attachment family protein [Bacillus]KKB74893.1 Replication initiation and membrane attachment protein [Bacillus sp. TH008]MDU0072836.1 replication initiation and membrane attachment family protein [Bacillus sp. IG6]MED8020630.1 replication initiation and membrane attachment family protein [Bacillus glycinifermentans]QAT66466.1 Replication initiation and membrane attachment protein [Bacillus glycinifermentans]WKB76198.1 replication initiation